MVSLFYGLYVREHLPLQQGLRHYRVFYPGIDPVGQRASSITTRIKTPLSAANASASLCQRASSITTRIKTNHPLQYVKEHSRSESIFHYNKDFHISCSSTQFLLSRPPPFIILSFARQPCCFPGLLHSCLILHTEEYASSYFQDPN